MEGIGKPIVSKERFLTHDEIVEFVGRLGVEMKFRIRIWRGKDATSVALVSPVAYENGRMSYPGALTIKTANYINQAMAGFPESTVLYFEYDSPSREEYKPTLSQIHFEYFGEHASRLMLYKPIWRATNKAYLEAMLGCKIDL